MLTSRMPALKAQAGVSEGEIGLLLLSLGLSALVMLLMSSLLVTKFGSRRVLGWGSLVCMAGIPVAAFAADFWVLWGAFILFGFGMGLWDVSMNVQGMGVERRYGKSSMLILHASYSTGSVIGAASGAFLRRRSLPSSLIFSPCLWCTLRYGPGPKQSSMRISPQAAPQRKAARFSGFRSSFTCLA